MPPYLRPGLALALGATNDPNVRALQHDLRALGYLRAGIDGNFGAGTTAAIKALQYDVLHNNGRGKDGDSPVAVTSFNTKPGGGLYVTKVTGLFDQNFAEALAAMMADERVAKLPASDDPVSDNHKALDAIRSVPSTKAPVPFVVAIVTQESNSQHFHVPRGTDQDRFVTVGLDRNDADPDHITSRGYGIGQSTLFHHPPSFQDVADTIAGPLRNVQATFVELRQKFDGAVVGKNGASDRMAEHPRIPLRLCRYAPSDARYMNDCRNCALRTHRIDITRGTPAYAGASISYQPTKYYPSAEYPGVPNRAEFLCDWPYAARRYNGGRQFLSLSNPHLVERVALRKTPCPWDR